MNWTEVTEQYAGYFFRAEGNISELFGHIQHAYQSTILAYSAHSSCNMVSADSSGDRFFSSYIRLEHPDNFYKQSCKIY